MKTPPINAVSIAFLFVGLIVGIFLGVTVAKGSRDRVAIEGR